MTLDSRNRWPLRAVSEDWRSQAVLQGVREDLDLAVPDPDALTPLGLRLCRSASGAWLSLEGGRDWQAAAVRCPVEKGAADRLFAHATTPVRRLTRYRLEAEGLQLEVSVCAGGETWARLEGEGTPDMSLPPWFTPRTATAP